MIRIALISDFLGKDERDRRFSGGLVFFRLSVCLLAIFFFSSEREKLIPERRTKKLMNPLDSSISDFENLLSYRLYDKI